MNKTENNLLNQVGDILNFADDTRMNHVVIAALIQKGWIRPGENGELIWAADIKQSVGRAQKLAFAQSPEDMADAWQFANWLYPNQEEQATQRAQKLLKKLKAVKKNPKEKG